MDYYTSFVLYGRYGSGKTTGACTAPFPIAVIDADMKARNQSNIQALVKSGDVDIFPLNYPLVAGNDEDFLFRPDSTNPVPDGYRECLRLINRIVKQEPKEYATIVFDSGSRIIQHLIQATVAANGKTQMTQQLWGVFYTELANRFTRLSTIPVNFIWIFHERTVIDEITKQQQVIVSIPGQMGEDIGTFFNEVYNSKVDEIGGKHYYYYVTKSNAKHNNRTSGTLDLNEQPNISQIISKLNGTYIALPQPVNNVTGGGNVVRSANVIRRAS